MTQTLAQLELGLQTAFRRQLAEGDEQSLHDAYELGRQALTEGCGVLDMVLLLWRASRAAQAARRCDGVDATRPSNGATLLDLAAGSAPDPTDEAVQSTRTEALLLEAMSPFEMLARGAREANEALRRVEERREEETRRVAHELHDESAQLLAAVHFALDDLRQYVPAEGQPRLDRMEGLLAAVEEEIRRIAYDLRPAVLDELGLLPALHSLASNVHRRSGLRVHVEAAIDERLPGGLENALYRAAQEALNNVVRHAHAKHVHVTLRHADGAVTLVVLDDGVGFEPGRTVAEGARRGLGLEGMHERLAPFEGSVDIRSQPGQGTEIRIRVPIEVNHAVAFAAR